MKNIFSIIALFGLFTLSSFNQPHDEVQQDVVQRIAAALRLGNATELAKYFNTTIDLTIPDKEGAFSKAQSEQIIKAFFQKNAVKSFEVNNHGASKGGSLYAIGTLSTSTDSYRVYYMIKSQDGRHLIQQLQIEKQ